MNTVWVLALRAIATLFNLQGKSKTASTINQILDAAEAGLNVDNHMAKVAEDLKAGIEPDWDDVIKRINDDSARLHGG